MSRRRRQLSPGEVELWLAVARTVRPREGVSMPEPPPAPAPPPSLPPFVPPPPAPGPFEGRAPFLPPYVPPMSRPRPMPPLAPFEKRYRRGVTSGRVDIDGAIDLHGMTQPQAHSALVGFLRGAARDGARLVLVVTGKGRARLGPGGRDASGGRDVPGSRSEIESGVLRRAVPLWLRAEDLRAVVMGFEEAGLTHGGLGALYVRLRRAPGR